MLTCFGRVKSAVNRTWKKVIKVPLPGASLTMASRANTLEQQPPKMRLMTPTMLSHSGMMVEVRASARSR